MKEKGAGVYAVFRKTPGEARGYAKFQCKKWDRKETGAGGCANFRKTQNTAGGYADFQLRESDMKETGAGGYANFRKKPQIQPEAMQIFDSEKVI